MAQIKNRFTGAVIYESDDPSLDLGATVKEYAAKQKARGERANLSRAYLSRAIGLSSPTPSDPPEPYARIAAESTEERIMRYRKRHPEVPIVEKLDRKILNAIEAGEHWK